MAEKPFFERLFGHLRTINHHKVLVMQHCFRVGLYKQGLLHDLSKYGSTEFWLGVRHFQGDRSPHDGERKEKGYSSAWLHHKGRNKHHLEYWQDYDPNSPAPVVGMRMPVEYVVEMFCDRVAASKNYRKSAYTDADAYDYYERNKHQYILHPETRELLEKLLLMLRDEGEERVFSYIREEVLHKDRK